MTIVEIQKVNLNNIKKISEKIRSFVTEYIIDMINDLDVDVVNNVNITDEYKKMIKYLPVKDSYKIVISNMVSKKIIMRFLIDFYMLKQKNNDVYSLINGSYKKEHNFDVLKPILNGNFERLDLETIKKVKKLVNDLNSIEILWLINDVFESSYKEFYYEGFNGSIEKHVNLAFINKTGIFYTPPRITNLIVNNCIKQKYFSWMQLLENDVYDGYEIIKEISDVKVLDPACGTGNFLLTYLQYIEKILMILNKKSEIDFNITEIKNKILQNTIYAIDINSNSVDVCKIILSLFFSDGFATFNNVYVGNALISKSEYELNDDIQKIDYNVLNPLDSSGLGLSIDPPEGVFDLIFLNPPYGKLKINKNEFNFSETLSDYKGKELETVIEEEKKYYGVLSDYFRNNVSFRYSIQGELNWYKLFFERSLKLLNEGGVLGCIIPLSILSSKRTSKLRKYVLKHFSIKKIISIPENATIFDTVNQPTVILIIKRKVETPFIEIITKDNNLEDLEFSVIRDIELIKKIDETLLPIPVISDLGYKILDKLSIYKRVGTNKHLVNKRGEFDLTKYKCYLSKFDEDTILVRGSELERYVFNKDINRSKNNRVNKAYLDVISKRQKKYFNNKRMVCRQCSYMGKKRRLSFAIIGKNHVVSNSCNFITSLDESRYPYEYLLAILNSSIMEWRFRLTSSNNHVGNYEIDNFNIPECNDNYITEEIVKTSNVIIKEYYSNEFGYSKYPIIKYEDYIDALIFILYGLDIDEIKYVLSQIDETERYLNVKKQYDKIHSEILYDHNISKLSDIDMQMIKSIPSGGNWEDIPEDIPSKRLEQMRQMREERGGARIRTTYYGRMVWDKPSYTVNTYFSRPGNGCFIHPDQDRLISIREAARLQSFPDWFRFYGSNGKKRNQIGNAVPPLLAYAVAKKLNGKTVVTPFSGAGGLSLGFKLAGYTTFGAQDIDSDALVTYKMNGLSNFMVHGDITNNEVKNEFIEGVKKGLNGTKLDVVAAGPPCQGFSQAGWYNRDDPRNELVYDYIDIVESLNPEYVVMENVQGLKWMEKGKVLSEIIKTFDSIGYDTNFQVLKAEEFGVPQRRRRVFIIGSLNRKPVFPDPIFASTGFNKKPIFTIEDAISDLKYIKPTKKNTISHYNSDWVDSDYQRWARGIITLEELYNKRKFKWNPLDDE